MGSGSGYNLNNLELTETLHAGQAFHVVIQAHINAGLSAVIGNIFVLPIYLQLADSNDTDLFSFGTGFCVRSSDPMSYVYSGLTSNIATQDFEPGKLTFKGVRARTLTDNLNGDYTTIETETFQRYATQFSENYTWFTIYAS